MYMSTGAAVNDESCCITQPFCPIYVLSYVNVVICLNGKA